MEYQRMTYAADQREWVKAADELLPGLIEKASKLQNDAAIWHKYCELHPTNGNLSLRRDFYKDAIFALNQVLYYQGMRAANL